MRTIFQARTAAAAAAIALSLLACKKPAEKPQAAAEVAVAAPLAGVKFGKIIEKRLPATLEASGSLDADETSEVAAPGAGVVTRVEVDVGSRVKKGDVLVALDGRDAASRLAQANASTAQATARLGLTPGEKFDPTNVADVRAAKEAMDLAVTDAQRTKNLFDTGGVSQAQWDEARARAEQTRAQYQAALNGARQAWAGLLLAQASAGMSAKQLGDTVIRAPFDGAVAEKRVTPGEYAPIGKVVVVVVRDRPLRLKFEVTEVDAGKVVLGADVVITVSAFPGKVFHGAVKRIGASLKTQSRSLPVEAEVANEDGALKPGFFARAEVALGGADVPAMLVPRSAVGTSGSASRVFIRAGTRVVERIVSLGRESDGLVEIRGTLSAADEVALDHVDTLSDGAEVRPQS